MYSIKNTVSETGIGMFSGSPIKLTISPTLESGIWFKNKYGYTQKLTPENVYIDNNNTSIKFTDGTKISVIEHLLSSIFAYGLTDIIIEVDGDEIPLFDGSAMSYTMLLDELILQKKTKAKIAYLKKKIRVEDGEFYVEAKPGKALLFKTSIDFKNTPIGKQSFKYKFSKDTFKQEIAMARTFGIVDDLETARKYYKGSNLDNTLIIQKGILLNQERIENEFVRHKILDSIGDIRAFEYPLMMEYNSYGSSHKLNNMLLRKIISENAFQIVEVINADKLLGIENEFQIAKSFI